MKDQVDELAEKRNEHTPPPILDGEKIELPATQKERFLGAAAGKVLEKLITAVRLPSGAIELAINIDDLDKKVEYIKNAYDDDMKLRTNPEIKMVGVLFVGKADLTYMPRAAVYDIFRKTDRAAKATYMVTVVKDHRDGTKNISIETDFLTLRCREILQGHDDRMYAIDAPIFQIVGFMLV